MIRVARSRGGDVVTIDHGSPGQTVYMGLGDVAVAPGEYVSAGQVIGRLPDVARPVLRFSWVRDGRAVNPHDYIHFPADGA